jgi:ankyrin repeat protein
MGADEDRYDNLAQGDRWTPLMFAAARGATEEVIESTSKKTDIDAKDPKGWTALMIAARFGQKDAVKTLLKLGARRDGLSTANLILATEQGAFELAKESLNSHAEVDARDTCRIAGLDVDKEGSGWTPLMYAAECGSEEIVKLLLAHGASLKMKTDTGWTVPMIAARSGRQNIVNLLLKSGGDQNGLSTADLFWASENGDLALAKKSLLSGAKVNARDVYRVVGFASCENSGSTPLINATAKNDLEMVKLLLKSGADPDLPDLNSDTPLLKAIAPSYDTITITLLANGANPNKGTQDGITPLMMAALRHQLDVVANLIKNGADLEARNNMGMTALMFAVNGNDLNCVNMLVEAGARIDAKDNHNRPASDYVRKNAAIADYFKKLAEKHK